MLLYIKVCGQNSIKKPFDEHMKKMIEENQVEKDPNYGICSNVVISDKYAITAAHCIQGAE